MSFILGEFPKKCKIEYITPLLKKSNKLESSNYGPISLLLNIEKFFEKAMYYMTTCNHFFWIQILVYRKNNSDYEILIWLIIL